MTDSTPAADGAAGPPTEPDADGAIGTRPATPRLVAFDLDDTLAASKSPVGERMAALLAALVARTEVCVISGGQFGQFSSQLIDRLPDIPASDLAHLHLMPTCGTQYYRYDDGWTRVYAEDLSDDQKSRATAAIEDQAKRLGLWEADTWGPVLEDRGSQITFSALGQSAPVDVKREWDADGTKKEALRAAVAPLLPDLEVRSGGSTSVDVTRKGIDKAYGMAKLAEITGIDYADMLFLGDRLDAGGNDFPVLRLGVPAQMVDGPDDTADRVAALVDELPERP